MDFKKFVKDAYERYLHPADETDRTVNFVSAWWADAAMDAGHLGVCRVHASAEELNQTYKVAQQAFFAGVLAERNHRHELTIGKNT